MENLDIYYANDNHLSIILSEYLKNKNKERCKIITFFQQGIEKNIKNIEKRIKENIINEEDFKEKKNPKEYCIRAEKINNEIIIIIRGDKKYINNVYNEIIKNNNITKLQKIKIIKCYNIESQENEIKQNIIENKKIISTTGENNIFKINCKN